MGWLAAYLYFAGMIGTCAVIMSDGGRPIISRVVVLMLLWPFVATYAVAHDVFLILLRRFNAWTERS